MDAKRRITLAWRCSLITIIIIAIFWTVWYLLAGSVPAVSEIKITERWTMGLTFEISRWWDVLAGAFIAALMVLFLTSSRLRTNDNGELGVGLSYGLIFGLFVGLGVGLGFGLGYGLVFGLFVGLVFGLVFGLGVGLGFGLVFGLSYGLVFGLVFGLGYGLGYGLVVGLKLLFSKKLKNWLLAR